MQRPQLYHNPEKHNKASPTFAVSHPTLVIRCTAYQVYSTSPRLSSPLSTPRFVCNRDGPRPQQVSTLISNTAHGPALFAPIFRYLSLYRDPLLYFNVIDSKSQISAKLLLAFFVPSLRSELLALRAEQPHRPGQKGRSRKMGVETKRVSQSRHGLAYADLLENDITSHVLPRTFKLLIMWKRCVHLFGRFRTMDGRPPARRTWQQVAKDGTRMPKWLCSERQR